MDKVKDWQWYLLYAFVFIPISLLIVSHIQTEPKLPPTSSPKAYLFYE